MANAIEIRPGDTLSLAGAVTLPAGVWSATCAFVSTETARVLNVDVTLNLVGPSDDDPSRNVWAIALEASSLETANWPAPSKNASASRWSGAIKFHDDSNPPLVKTSEPFEMIIRPKVVP
jgi:hypothetical protein